MRKRTFLVGHRGLAGSAIHRVLMADPNTELTVADRTALDLRDQGGVAAFFDAGRFDEIILAAAKVGGIHANNTLRTDFLLENLQIQTNIISSALQTGVKNLIFLGSSCIYPKGAECPIKESALLTGPLEYTNEPYAIAKIAGLKLCESISQLQSDKHYITLMPCNLYGLNDNYDLLTSHVFPAVILKVFLARLLNQRELEKAFILLKLTQKSLIPESINEVERYLGNVGVDENSIELWGTGRPQREFMYVDDLANAVSFIRDDYVKAKDASSKTNFSLNCGSRLNVSIADLAKTVSAIVDYGGNLRFKDNDLDGTYRKDLNSDVLRNLGWHAETSLETGISNVVRHLEGLLQ